MKKHKTIKGRAIALRCIREGSALVTPNEIYLGIPYLNYKNHFRIYLPKLLTKSKTVSFPKYYFEPINPSHKHDPRYY